MEFQTHSERLMQKALEERMQRRYQEEKACQEEQEYLSDIAVELMMTDPEDN